MKSFLSTIILFSAFVLASPTAYGAIFVVNTTDDTADATPGDGICATASANCSLRAAISEANALAGDDVITLPAGAYTQTLVAANEDLNAGGDLDITSNITINGAGQDTTFIQANASPGVAIERVLNVRAAATVVVNGVTIRNGRFTGTMTTATRGAGIENLGSLTLTNSTVRDNQINATVGNPIGGGISNAGPALTLNGSTVTANSNVRVTGGSAFGGGVGSLAPSTIVITNSSISGNASTSQAGGFGFGAGLYMESTWNVTATNSSFNNNTGSGTSGSNGTGIRALSNAGAAVLNLTNCTLSGNTTGAAGINQGVGIQLFATAAAASFNATLVDVTISGNGGNGPGAGINVAPSGGSGSLTVRNSTISGNNAGTNGGGIAVLAGAVAVASPTVTITNSTISGNTATSNGGGVSVEQPSAGVAIVNFNFATVAGNTAGATGGGVARVTANGTANLKNSIVANNAAPAGPDLSGTINSQDYNHFGSIAGATIGGTTTNNATGDPLIGPLANNGGPTLTRLPGPGSPVINTIPNGTNDCGGPITTDQRGVARPSGGSCDKGSVEVSAAAPAYIAGGVFSLEGRAISRAIVTLSGGGLPSPRFEYTNNFGVFRFEGLPTGQTYTLSVVQRRYTFTPPSRNILLTGNLDNENFFASSPTLQKGEVVLEMGEQP